MSAVRTTALRRPHSRVERGLLAGGADPVVGCDEVGRGAWAGPVSVGAVVYDPVRRPPRGVRDSKQLTEPERESLYPRVVAWAPAWAVGHASPAECDALGMTAALRLAARRALAGLGMAGPRLAAATVILDGSFDYVTDIEDPRPGPAVHTVVKGDAACVSVAAASVVAKVTRDRLMRELATSFPAYEFDRNKGYPAPVHRTALAGYGLTSIHRRSWAFVEDMAFR